MPNHGPLFRPPPIRELVVKLYERCNLACSYCYMYEAADQGWRDRPTVMAPVTLAQLALRTAEHAREHDIDTMRVVLHGGEPLMAGLAAVTHALTVFKEALAPKTSIVWAVQTNGLLIDEPFLRLFRDHGVRVGVSIDGGRAANDRHRRNAAGRSSYDPLVRGIGLLRRPENQDIYGGLLCTIDVRNDPAETLLSLLAHHPPQIDFLLPHGNWAFPPPGLDGRGTTGSAVTPYADWLITIFDRWYSAPRREVGIRLFDSIISLLLGGASDTEAIGPGIPASVVIETDGSVEGNDALKTTGPSGGATGLNVFSHSFDDVLGSPLISAARSGLSGLGPVCRRCPVVGVCGGGLHAHRYHATEGFSRPSVFCADLYRLVTHIRTRVEADLRMLSDRMASHNDGGSM